jgi:hypothetical protein
MIIVCPSYIDRAADCNYREREEKERESVWVYVCACVMHAANCTETVVLNSITHEYVLLKGKAVNVSNSKTSDS